jgi:hypothetical protein
MSPVMRSPVTRREIRREPNHAKTHSGPAGHRHQRRRPLPRAATCTGRRSPTASGTRTTGCFSSRRRSCSARLGSRRCAGGCSCGGRACASGTSLVLSTSRTSQQRPAAAGRRHRARLLISELDGLSMTRTLSTILVERVLDVLTLLGIHCWRWRCSSASRPRCGRRR